VAPAQGWDTVIADDSTYESFTTEIAGARVLAHVPVAAKKTCERLMRKSDHDEDERDYLHENYWVEVYYRGQRHGYKGTDDTWTYSARDLPEFLLLYEWMYLILGKRKLRVDRPLQTTEIREEAVWAEARRGPFVVQVSFRPRGHKLSFVLRDEGRWKEHGSYNVKTRRADFPFYYSEAQAQIVEWGIAVYGKGGSDLARPRRR
jgi:hypothetical protein